MKIILAKIRLSVPRGQNRSQELREIDESCPGIIKWWFMTAKVSNIAQGGVRVEFRVFQQLTLSIYAEFYVNSESGNGFCQGAIQERFIAKILFCKPSRGNPKTQEDRVFSIKLFENKTTTFVWAYCVFFVRSVAQRYLRPKLCNDFWNFTILGQQIDLQTFPAGKIYSFSWIIQIRPPKYSNPSTRRENWGRKYKKIEMFETNTLTLK